MIVVFSNKPIEIWDMESLQLIKVLSGIQIFFPIVVNPLKLQATHWTYGSIQCVHMCCVGVDGDQSGQTSSDKEEV